MPASGSAATTMHSHSRIVGSTQSSRCVCPCCSKAMRRSLRPAGARPFPERPFPEPPVCERPAADRAALEMAAQLAGDLLLRVPLRDQLPLVVGLQTAGQAELDLGPAVR